MSEITLSESKVQGSLGSARDSLRSQSRSKTAPSLSWKDSLPIQRLLDVVSSIIAEEYITIAKHNPEVFIKQGETK